MVATLQLKELAEKWVDHLIGDGPDCLRCAHYLEGNKCKAFPDGIPKEARYGANHVEPLPNDNGFQFEEKRKPNLNYSPSQPRDSRGTSDLDDSITTHELVGFSVSANTRWQFREDADKLTEFLDWLRDTMADEVLGAEEEQAEAEAQLYWERYLRKGYGQGAARAFADVRAVERATTEKLDFYEGTLDEFLRSAFARPQTGEKVRLLARRTFTDLKNVTDDMATRIGRALVDGLVRGDSPNVIARNMMQVVDSIGKPRALLIARTEIVRAHAEGQLDAMEKLGVDKLGVMVEWQTNVALKRSGPCPLCAALNGLVITLEQARGLLPRHPNCKCAWVPAIGGEGKRRAAKDAQGKIDESVRREIAKKRKGKRSVARQKALSRWKGAGVKVKKAPKSVLD